MLKTPKRLKSLKLSLSAMLVAICLSSRGSLAQMLPLPPNLIDFTSNEGETLLLESQSRQDYFPLSVQFVTQDNQAYCGVASMVMVLNALGILAPQGFASSEYHFFTQQNIFANSDTQKVMTAEEVGRSGMTLEQLKKLLVSYPVQVTVYYGSDVSLEQFRKLSIQNLKEPRNFILVNYLRRSIGQETGGHISPIAAYNEKSDRFLILDVSRYKYPPFWVKAEDLWQAIRTVDPVSGKTRGFVEVKSQE